MKKKKKKKKEKTKQTKTAREKRKKIQKTKKKRFDDELRITQISPHSSRLVLYCTTVC